MCGQVVVTLLVPRVFGDEMEVFTTNNKGSVHFGGDNGAGEDTTTDGDLACEGAFLVCRIMISKTVRYDQNPRWARR